MKNDPTWKKFIFMTLVVIATAGILGVAGFYLWFVFPVQKIKGLTYLRTSDLFIYYGLINLSPWGTGRSEGALVLARDEGGGWNRPAPSRG